jgi:hypothetical protein
MWLDEALELRHDTSAPSAAWPRLGSTRAANPPDHHQLHDRTPIGKDAQQGCGSAMETNIAATAGTTDLDLQMREFSLSQIGSF